MGRVINMSKLGKTNALSDGLDAAEMDFLVRVDADTLVGENNLTRSMPCFFHMAVVGGVPVPPGGTLFDRACSLPTAPSTQGILMASSKA
jgi:cellulose synthase/poly-beta-1,6-N-acetylglucosamine synthase-like glycosyltransferase